MSCTTTISGAVGNTLNYRSTTAKMSSRLKVAGFFLFLCFVLFFFAFFFLLFFPREESYLSASHAWVLSAGQLAAADALNGMLFSWSFLIFHAMSLLEAR